MLNSTEIKRQLPDEELLSFGYLPPKVSTAGNVYSPGEPITREMILEYYYKVESFILPYVTKRPQDIKRDLTFDEAFFLKEGHPDTPVWINKIKGAIKKDKEITTVYCNNKSSFYYLANRGLTEINLWHSTIEALEYPNYLVIDLDPSSHNTFAQVKRVARVLKSILDKAGAESFCKTTGATGLHVFIPLGGRYPYPIVREFAFTLCMLTHKRIPEITCMNKNRFLKNHKIFLDYQQNKLGKTIASVYSVRLLKGAPVSTPIAWEELTDELNPYDFNIFTVPDRLRKQGDLFGGLLGEGINIRNCIGSLASL